MKKAIVFFLKYYLFWICFFISFKLIFLLMNFEATRSLSAIELGKVFLYGAKMDLSAAAYLSLLPGIIIALLPFLSEKPVQTILKYYTLILLILMCILGFTDAALYAPWGTRLNAQFLPYLANPVGIWNCLNWWQWLVAVCALFILICVSFFIYRRIFWIRYRIEQKPKWYVAPLIVFLSACLIIPIRGGFDRSPLNFSSVYFSNKLYANHAAYNYFWSFMFAVSHKDIDKNPVHYMDDKEAASLMNGFRCDTNEQLPVYLKKTDKPVNVVYVILESFSNKIIEPLGGIAKLTPNLNRFCKEGIVFSNFYATGSRSDRGISALLASYPGLIKASAIINYPEKMKKLDLLPAHFKQKGYNLSFYYGGDVNFYNTRMLLMMSGVSKIVSKDEFAGNENLQKWGISDEFLYQRLFNDLQKTPQPFMSMVYNISSHEPFDIPGKYNKYPGNDSQSKYFNAVAYTDSCLGKFVAEMKNSELWKNTLIVITADHASLEPGPTSLEDLNTFKIPLIWIGGVVDKAMKVENIGSQTDVGTTLLQQLGWDSKTSCFAKNLFAKKDYAFFYNIDGWGYVSPAVAFYTNAETNNRRFYYGQNEKTTPSTLKKAQAYTQYLHQDFINR